MMTNQKQVRAAFWIFAEDRGLYQRRRKTWRQNQYNTDTRCAFVDFVDMLQKSGEISEKLAGRVTL